MQPGSRFRRVFVASTSAATCHSRRCCGWLESRIDGICVHEARGVREIVVPGLPVTSPARTFVYLADLLALVDLVVVRDAIVRLGLCSPTRLCEEAAAARTRRVRLARRARAAPCPLGLADGDRLRLLLVLAGVAERRTNVDVRADDGLRLARPDLSYPELRIAIEYDGRHHLLDDDQRARDFGRKEALDRWLACPFRHALSDAGLVP